MNKGNNIKLKKFKTTYGEHPLMLTDNTIGFAMDVKELIKHHEQMNIPLDIITSITEIKDYKPTSASSLPESVEEAAVKGFNARLGTEKDGAYYFGFKDGSDWHQTHNSTEVERLRTQNEQCIEIFKWLLGHYDFPEPPKEGRPRYYWRSHLQDKLKESGIEIKNIESPFQKRETDI